MRGMAVALPKIGFNEGSLLRRTLLHVGTFVLGSVAFIGIMSLILVSVAKGLVNPPASSAQADDEVNSPLVNTPLGAATTGGVGAAGAKPRRTPTRRPTPGARSIERPGDKAADTE